MPISVPVWWTLMSGELGEEYALSSPLGLLTEITDRMDELQELSFILHVCSETNCDQDLTNFGKKLVSIIQQLASKSFTFTLLRNIPNATFEEIFYELGPHYEDTIKHCTNAGQPCKKSKIKRLHSGQFPICYDYPVQENKSSNMMSDEGISNGITFILNTGVQLGSAAFQAIMQKYQVDEPFAFAGFQNTLSPFSADGFRLMINSPGVMPNIDQQGINISPGFSTLIAITGKEIIRLPEPYSQCTQNDYELQLLREKTISFLGKAIHLSGGDIYSTYTPQDCRSACLQRLILEECHCLDLDSKLPFENINENLCGALNQTGMNMLLEPYKYDKQDCFENVTELGTSEKCSFLHKMIYDLACVAAVRKKYTDQTATGEIQCNCPPACHSYQYDMRISQSPWPAAGPETQAAYHDLVWIDEDKYEYLQNQPDL